MGVAYGAKHRGAPNPILCLVGPRACDLSRGTDMFHLEENYHFNFGLNKFAIK
jgi:hypothetical protein